MNMITKNRLVGAAALLALLMLCQSCTDKENQEAKAKQRESPKSPTAIAPNDKVLHHRANADAVEWTKDLLSNLGEDPVFLKALAIYEELNSKERAQDEAVRQRLDEATRTQKEVESQIDSQIATNPALKDTWEHLKNEERNLDKQMWDLFQSKAQQDHATERLEVTRALQKASNLLEKEQPLKALPSA
jgi:hypothetical protein